MTKKFFMALLLFVAIVFSIQISKAGDFGYDYIIPDSSRRLLTTDDLTNLTPWELKVARNEIYARHGRPFKYADLKCYFQGKSWYRVNSRFSDKLLNTYEQKNVVKILNYEKQIHSPITTKDMGCNYSKHQDNSQPSSESYGSDYVIPDSGQRALSSGDLSGLSPWQLKVARNEIYARHGRPFKFNDLRCYFESQSWYSVNPNYSDKLLNNFEQKNAVKILNYEKQIGSKVMSKDMGCKYGTR